MENIQNRLENAIASGQDYFNHATNAAINKKPHSDKWSKKEILGHLIDSGIHNLQRFTEIQFESQPYKIRKYNQDELVKANDYQNSKTNEIVDFWTAINNRIIYIIQQQTEKTLDYKIELDNGKISDLRFLITDYVDHLEYHLNQIKSIEY